MSSNLMPAILTGELAIPLGDPHHYVNVRELQKTLTARYAPMGEQPVEVECFAIDDNYLYAPRQFGIEYCRHESIPINDQTAQGTAVEFTAVNPPRDYQVNFIDDLMACTETHYDFLARAHTGFGKTYCGLATAARLGTTTLIVVDQDNLKDQWLEALETHFGLTIENGGVGIIQGKVCDYQRTVVIAMVQTLSQKIFPQEVYDYFGLMLIDEVHTIGAPTFSIVLRQFSATYRIGLSATPKRKDGLQKLLDYNLGKIRVAADKQHDESAVYFLTHPTVYSWYANISPKVGRILTEVAEDGSRNLMIAEAALYLYETGRDVIVLGDRIEQLQDIISLLHYMGVERGVAGLYAGGKPHWQWKKNPTPARKPEGLVKHADSGEAEYTPISLQLITKKIPKKKLLAVKKEAKMMFACVSEDTECLTLEGWKTYGQLREGELIAAYDIHSKTIKYTPLRNVAVYDYDGELCHISNRYMDALMTWNHRNIINHEGRKVFCRADRLDTQSSLSLRGRIENYPENEGLGSDDLAELMGWIIAEGNYQDRRIKIAQKAGHKAARIDHLIAQLRLEHTRRECPGQMINWHLSTVASKKIMEIAPDKDLNQFLVSLPRRELEGLYWGLMQGDGCIREANQGMHTTFIQKSKSTVDWFTIIALRLDYMPLIQKSTNQAATHIGLTRTVKTSIYQQKTRLQAKPAQYTGKVWCPVTDYGTWVARRNGKVFTTGNTYGMCAKGFDEPRLCAGIDATPRGAAEQIHGRILRMKVRKMPIWVTIVDENNYRLVFSFGNRIADYAKSNARIFRWNRNAGKDVDNDEELIECHANTLQKQARARKASLQSMQIAIGSNGSNMLVTGQSAKTQKKLQEIATVKSRIKAVRASPGLIKPTEDS